MGRKVSPHTKRNNIGRPTASTNAPLSRMLQRLNYRDIQDVSFPVQI